MAPLISAKQRAINASIYDPQVKFLEIGVNVNGVWAYKVYGPDLNGVNGGLQGTGGLEATIMNGTGTATGVINDAFGNGVATISGGSVTWNPTHVGGYGPLPDSSAQPLTDATQLAQDTVWRSRRIDPTGFYYLGSRYYEPTSGRFLSPDPKGQAASMSLYDFCNGDPVNFFDPWGLSGMTTQQQIQQATTIRNMNLAVVQSYTGYNALSNLDAGSTAGAGAGVGIGIINTVHDAQPLSTDGQLGTTVFRSDQDANILGGVGNGLAVLGAGVDAYSALRDARNGDTNGAVLNSANVGADLTGAALNTDSIVTGLGLAGEDAFLGPAGLALAGGQLAINSYVTYEEASMAKDTADANVQAALQTAQLAQTKIDQLNQQLQQEQQNQGSQHGCGN
jgi:RHS repeat-associated protein